MPHAAPNKAETAPNAPDRTSPPSGGPRPEPHSPPTAPPTRDKLPVSVGDHQPVPRVGAGNCGPEVGRQTAIRR